jgi:tryptophan-rich sensory protein
MKWLKLILCIALPLLVGALSGIATAEGVSGWYQTAIKPSFNPPNYVFAPVWTLLYTLMGISFFLLLNEANGKWKTIGIALFLFQLALNFWWSFLFFKFQALGWSLVEIIVLWLSIAAMIFSMYKSKPIIGYLQIPYICWVSFATILNLSLWWLNKP